MSLAFRLPLSIGICLLSTLAVAGESWPQFRGPDGDGHTSADRLPLTWSETENICWKTAIHDRGWSSPVIWNDQIWLTTAREDGREMYALCVDAETGNVLHDVKLFDVKEPEEIHATNSYASPTPVIEEDRVYVHFGSYGTACLNTKTADVLWTRRDLPCQHFRGPGSSPILFEHLLIVHYDGFDYQYVVALDKHTGETVWKVDRDIDYGTTNGDFMKAYCTPSIIEVDGQLQLISPTSKASLAYDPLTGKELWRVRFEQFSATARPLYGHGLVFINTGFGKAELMAVRPTGSGDITDTHVQWHVKRGIGSKPSPLLVEDLLYVLHDAGTATCLEAKTGEEVWQKRIGGSFSASPLFGSGHIYLFDEEGVCTVLRPGRTYEALSSNKLETGCMASPAVYKSDLIVRTKTHLYRIGQ